jgi:hypothetical protein
MEELAERISDGESTVFLVAVSSDHDYEMYAGSFQLLLRKCPNLNIMYVKENDTKIEVQSDRLHMLCNDDAVPSPELSLCLAGASLVFLVNLSLFLNKTGTISAKSMAILSNISRQDVNTFCLHPFERIRGAAALPSGPGVDEPCELINLRLMLQDISMIHMVSRH